MGVRVFRKTQLAVEATKGTTLPATTVWRGTSGMNEDTSTLNFVEEDVANLGGSDKTNISKQQSAITLEGSLNFEQFPYICASGIKNVVTGVADGGGSDYIYAYPFPTTAAATTKALTIENGDDTQAYTLPYCFPDQFTLTGRIGEAVKLTANMIGRKRVKQAFTAALPLPTVEDVVFPKSKLYIDAIGGTIGTTQKTATLLGFNYTCKTGWIPVMSADGNLYFSTLKNTGPEITLDITYEYNANAVAMEDSFAAETAWLVRLQMEGTAAGTAGTVYTYKTINLDMAAKVSKVTPISEQDGNDIITVTFTANYNATAAYFAGITVVNELSALP